MLGAWKQRKQQRLDQHKALKVCNLLSALRTRILPACTAALP